VANRNLAVSTRTGIILVAVGSALWGTDALFRRGLALQLPAVEVVFWEHLLLVACTLPLIVRGLRVLRGRPLRDWAAIAIIGGGSSVAATVLLTEAFQLGDPSTPLLLQKLQHVIVALLASLLLSERLRPRYFAYLAAALASSYLIAFADPTEVTVDRLVPALLGAGAAALWALGTVLGKHLSANIAPAELTGLRFGFGLPVAAILVIPFGADDALLAAHAGDAGALIGLALVPGLLALLLYYQGLRAAPATAATIAELSFPLTALIVNAIAFGDRLSGTQLAGAVLLAGTVALFGIASRRGPQAVGVRPTARPATGLAGS
jgi:drug/metabolite transporter (DMT)-like permease